MFKLLKRGTRQPAGTDETCSTLSSLDLGVLACILPFLHYSNPAMMTELLISSLAFLQYSLLPLSDLQTKNYSLTLSEVNWYLISILMFGNQRKVKHILV